MNYFLRTLNKIFSKYYLVFCLIFLEFLKLIFFSYKICLVLGRIKLVKSKKVILPGVDWKSLKSINSILSPAYILVPLIFVFLIAQVVDDLV